MQLWQQNGSAVSDLLQLHWTTLIKVSEHSLRVLSCTADVNKRAHKALRKTKMEPEHQSFHFVQWRLRNWFFCLIKQFVMCQKRLFFNVLKVILLENTLPFWDCLYGSILSNAAHAQKTVTAWFSGNALISTEPLVRISWNLVE